MLHGVLLLVRVELRVLRTPVLVHHLTLALQVFLGLPQLLLGVRVSLGRERAHVLR